MTQPREHTLRHALLALGFKALVSGLVLLSGFRALSDDDYARIVTAQRFATTPSFDPSGTSWLPFPFWLNGGVMLALSRDIWVARSVAYVCGLLSVLLCFLAARRLGFSSRAALLGGVLAGAFPYSAWLGVATVPELLTAALIVFGAASAGDRNASLRSRLWGAAALCVAALSRYEAWPVALAFAAFALWDARRSPRIMLAAVVCCGGPGAWLLHGARSHGDAFFFVKRVAEYHRAVGAGGRPLVLSLVEKPLAFLRCEPELAAVLILLTLASVLAKQRLGLGRPRFFVCLGALLAFVILADVRGAAATHHAERVVLSLWLASALWVGHLALAVPARLPRSGRRLLGVSVALAVVVSSLWLRPWFARRDGFIDRSGHLALGRIARNLEPTARVVVDTSDFGFYAVIAGHGDPRLVEPLDDRDPRRAPAGDPFADPETLRAALIARGAVLLVASGDAHRNRARLVAFELARAGELALFQLTPGH